MSIESTRTYKDPDTDIFLTVEEDGFKINMDGASLYFREGHDFHIGDMLTYMIELFTAAKGDLERLQ